ncbi:MAG: Tat pathway signal protein, partial [Phenylobacterium sp.]|nr:Tat pathway signal protein [Phenylobacterium sp.]
PVAAAPPSGTPQAGPPPAPPPPTAEQQLNGLLDQFFSESLVDSPELASSLGLDKGPHADLKSKLHDGSLAALERDKQKTARRVVQMEALDRANLSGMAGINYDSVLYDLKATDAANRRFAYGEQGAGNPYVISQITGSFGQAPDFLATQHTLETRADCEAYVARLAALGRLIDDESERVRHDVGLGVVPPDFALKGAIASMKTINVAPDKSVLVTSLVERARAKGIAGDWQAQASAVYLERVSPALQRQSDLMASLLPKSTHEAGVWRLPDGEAYYAAALQAATTTTMTPQEVHQLGLDVGRELSARADLLFRKIGMSQGTVGARYKALFKSKKYIYPNTDAGKAKLVADLNLVVQDMQKRLPEYFGALPKAGLEIRRIPKETEQGASTHYNAGSLDGARPGIYWLNLRDTAESPYWDMLTTTYHEGVPGHHLQLTLALQADLPMLRRVAGFNAYQEGWALYAEQLAQEMGVYADDPAGELGYIHDALLRSGRLVTDTGIHALRWSREKASATLSSIEGDPIALANQEIERYAVWPGQACSYMVGKVTILGLRDKARTALGPAFDIKKFHDAVLLAGAMPLTVLASAVDNYIAGAKRG